MINFDIVVGRAYVVGAVHTALWVSVTNPGKTGPEHTLAELAPAPVRLPGAAGVAGTAVLHVGVATVAHMVEPVRRIIPWAGTVGLAWSPPHYGAVLAPPPVVLLVEHNCLCGPREES